MQPMLDHGDDPSQNLIHPFIGRDAGQEQPRFDCLNVFPSSPDLSRRPNPLTARLRSVFLMPWSEPSGPRPEPRISGPPPEMHEDLTGLSPWSENCSRYGSRLRKHVRGQLAGTRSHSVSENSVTYRDHNFVMLEGVSSPFAPWGEVTPRCRIQGYPQVVTVFPWGEVTRVWGEVTEGRLSRGEKRHITTNRSH